MATLHANVRSRPTEEFLNRHETPGMRPDRGMFILRDCVMHQSIPAVPTPSPSRDDPRELKMNWQMPHRRGKKSSNAPG